MSEKLTIPNRSKELKILKKKLYKGNKGGVLSNERVAYNKWLNENTGIKVVNGKKVRVWKEGNKYNNPAGTELKLDTKRVGFILRKDKQFMSSDVKGLFYTEYYGTKTPYKDLQYLEQSERNRLKINVQKGDRIRSKLSQVDYKGENIYEQQVDAREQEAIKKLNKLKVGTSFAEPVDPITDNEQKDRDLANKINIKLVKQDKNSEVSPVPPQTSKAAQETWNDKTWHEKGAAGKLSKGQQAYYKKWEGRSPSEVFMMGAEKNPLKINTNNKINDLRIKAQYTPK